MGGSQETSRSENNFKKEKKKTAEQKRRAAVECRFYYWHTREDGELPIFPHDRTEHFRSLTCTLIASSGQVVVVAHQPQEGWSVPACRRVGTLAARRPRASLHPLAHRLVVPRHHRNQSQAPGSNVGVHDRGVSVCSLLQVWLSPRKSQGSGPRDRMAPAEKSTRDRIPTVRRSPSKEVHENGNISNAQNLRLSAWVGRESLLHRAP